VAVSLCIGRMVPHGLPKGFHRIRDDGVQAPKTLARLKGRMQETLAKVQSIVKGAGKRRAPMTSRQRYQRRPGRDPLRCPSCQHAMEVGRLWPPTSGVLHAALKAIARGQEASQAPRADPTARSGRPLWATAGGVPLALSGRR
jgi:hypothetical protein